MRERTGEEMVVAEPRGRTCRHVGHDPLPQHARRRLRECFSPRQVVYIGHVLTAGELSVIADPADAMIIARIKRMPDRRLRRFDGVEPADPEDRRMYALLQLDWLRDEEYLLGTRLGRRPTHAELFADFMRNHNGLRFRAYFALKHPHRVRQRCRSGSGRRASC